MLAMIFYMQRISKDITLPSSCGKMRYMVVDDSWLVQKLKNECKRRGFANYSRLNKAELIDELNREGAESIGMPKTTLNPGTGLCSELCSCFPPLPR